jgi:hypothetical protein
MLDGGIKISIGIKHATYQKPKWLYPALNLRDYPPPADICEALRAKCWVYSNDDNAAAASGSGDHSSLYEGKSGRRIE